MFYVEHREDGEPSEFGMTFEDFIIFYHNTTKDLSAAQVNHSDLGASISSHFSFTTYDCSLRKLKKLFECWTTMGTVLWKWRKCFCYLKSSARIAIKLVRLQILVYICITSIKVNCRETYVASLTPFAGVKNPLANELFRFFRPRAVMHKISYARFTKQQD